MGPNLKNQEEFNINAKSKNQNAKFKMKKNSVCEKCRKAGVKLFLKGERCFSAKCALVKRSYRAGQHGQKHKKLSEYANQLLEKQKAKAMYGLRERQFKGYFLKASKSRKSTGERLLQMLELRLDNLVYRLGFAPSRAAARQLVSHGHIKVNGRKVDIPSYQVKPNDQIEVASKIQPLKVPVPAWLKRDAKKLSGTLAKLPERENLPSDIDEAKILEFYAR